MYERYKMENIKENFELPTKDINIIGKLFYNTKTDKYGIISGITLERYASKLGNCFKAYYDRIESDAMVFAEDFYNGNLKFIIITGYDIDIPRLEKLKNQQIKEIKEFMGDRFSNNTILYITNENHKKKLSEQEYRGILEIMGKAKELDSLAADIVQDNYSMLKYFTLFVDGIITENQMLYGIVNVLSSELRTKRDNELKENGKIFNGELKLLLKETLREWIDKNPEKYVEKLKGNDKNE